MRRQKLDAFIRFALRTLPQRIASEEEARAVLIAEGIITANGELAAEYRPAVTAASYSASRRAQQVPHAAERISLLRRVIALPRAYRFDISLRSCGTAMLAGLRILVQTREGPDR
jgi:hypothetical protein